MSESERGVGGGGEGGGESSASRVWVDEEEAKAVDKLSALEGSEPLLLDYCRLSALEGPEPLGPEPLLLDYCRFASRNVKA